MKVPHNIATLVCELCGGGHHEEKIILCDSCDRGCHMFCLDPPMVTVPRGEWVCPLCTVDEAAGSNAFQEGDDSTLTAFEEAAARFKSEWGDEVQPHASPPCCEYLLRQLCLSVLHVVRAAVAQSHRLTHCCVARGDHLPFVHQCTGVVEAL